MAKETEGSDFQGAFGNALGDCFRIENAPSFVTRSRVQTPLAVTELRSDHPNLGRTRPLPVEDAHLVALQFREVVNHELFLGGRRVGAQPLRSGDTTIYDLSKGVTAEIFDPFHSLYFYVPQRSLDEVADELGAARGFALEYPLDAGMDDNVVREVGGLMVNALAAPESVNGLFSSHLMQALVNHVAHTYGGVRPVRPLPNGVLAPWQERRAKEMIEANLDRSFHLDEIARACGLSASYFARAFRRGTGVPPHRWLLHRRVTKAKHLLLTTSLTLVEIALASGFADQSHMTRVFSSLLNCSPGAWRRVRGIRDECP